MFEMLKTPVLGLIENMGVYHCPECGHEAHIFGQGGVKAEADKLGPAVLRVAAHRPRHAAGGRRGHAGGGGRGADGRCLPGAGPAIHRGRASSDPSPHDKVIRGPYAPMPGASGQITPPNPNFSGGCPIPSQIHATAISGDYFQIEQQYPAPTGVSRIQMLFLRTPCSPHFGFCSQKKGLRGKETHGIYCSSADEINDGPKGLNQK